MLQDEPELDTEGLEAELTRLYAEKKRARDRYDKLKAAGHAATMDWEEVLEIDREINQIASDLRDREARKTQRAKELAAMKEHLVNPLFGAF